MRSTLTEAEPVLSSQETQIMRVIDLAYYNGHGQVLDGHEIAAKFHSVPLKALSETQEKMVRQTLIRLEKRGVVKRLDYTNSVPGRPRLKWTRNER